MKTVKVNIVTPDGPVYDIIYWAVGSNDIDFNGLHAFTLLGPD